MTQALAFWSNILQFEGDSYIVLLDIAKAYLSNPHPLLWATIYTLGVPLPMISTLRHAYEHTQCCFSVECRQHTYRQKRGVTEGHPLSPAYFVLCTRIFAAHYLGGSFGGFFLCIWITLGAP